MKYLVLVLSFVGFLYSCSENPDANDVLTQAQFVVAENPDEALDLLNQISHPEEMGLDNYMQYIVALVQAKHEAKQDLTNDTLVHKAQRYFLSKNNKAQLALADFYGAWVAYQNKDLNNSIAGFIQAETDALSIGDYRLAGRSANNVGFLYFQHEVMDTAVVYLNRSISHYRKAKNSEELMMQSLAALGRAYECSDRLDLAYDTSIQALELANKMNDEVYQSKLKNNIGWVFYRKKEYEEAKKYLLDAFNYKVDEQGSIRTCINLAKVYSASNKLDSAQYYCNIILKKSEVSSNRYLQEAIYDALTSYYKQTGDYKQTLKYSDLKTGVVEQIEKENQAKKIYESRMKAHLESKENELQESEAQNHLYLLCGLFILFMLFFVFFFVLRSIRRYYIEGLNEVEFLKTKYHHRIENLLMLQNTYMNTMTGLMGVDRRARLLEQGSKDRSEIYSRTKSMVQEMKLRTRSQLIDWAIDYITENPLTEPMIKQFDEDDILLLALLGCRYTEKEIELILDMSHDVICLHKLELRNLFEVRGFSSADIDKLLFVENNRIYRYE